MSNKRKPKSEPATSEVAAVEVAEDKDFAALSELLAGYSSATPKCLKLVLDKARRLGQFSDTVKLAVLLLRADQFNMGIEPQSPESAESTTVFNEGDSIYDHK